MLSEYLGGVTPFKSNSDAGLKIAGLLFNEDSECSVDSGSAPGFCPGVCPPNPRLELGSWFDSIPFAIIVLFICFIINRS